ncbi:phage tail fiber protein [Reyranella sp.]|uniref:phage tail fiber protein n=1 Tax=Reyranella sp. TaxID=1929291 RepID=UPI003D109BE7
MSKGNTFESDVLDLILNGTPIANIADNAASSPLANLYVSLHTADPGEGGSQTTSELSYTGYARQAVSRGGSGWTGSGNSRSPAAEISFPVSTGGAGGTITHFAVGTAVSGTGKILYSGALNVSIAVSSGVQPKLSTATTITED